MATAKRPLTVRVRYFFCAKKECHATLGFHQDTHIEEIHYGDEGASGEVFPGDVIPCVCGTEYRIR